MAILIINLNVRVALTADKYSLSERYPKTQCLLGRPYWPTFRFAAIRKR